MVSYEGSGGRVLSGEIALWVTLYGIVKLASIDYWVYLEAPLRVVSLQG